MDRDRKFGANLDVTPTAQPSGSIMQPSKLRALLEQVRGGVTEVKAAEVQLLESMRGSAFEDLEFARIDHHRAIRQGFPEVIFGEGKTKEQITEIAIHIMQIFLVLWVK